MIENCSLFRECWATTCEISHVIRVDIKKGLMFYDSYLTGEYLSTIWNSCHGLCILRIVSVTILRRSLPDDKFRKFTMRNPIVLLCATLLTIRTIANVTDAINFDAINSYMFKTYFKPLFPLGKESLYNAYARLPPAAFKNKPGEKPSSTKIQVKG